ncbi:MAG: HAMP domain-containing histidine kinase [Myxococcota bacterium]|nr:HAMP domain-containing histidine kinase [Myxococcota bacterium]
MTPPHAQARPVDARTDALPMPPDSRRGRHARATTPGARRKLAWKLNVIGFVQLVLLAAAVAAVGFLLGRSGVFPEPVLMPARGQAGAEMCFPAGSFPYPPSPVRPLLSFLLSGLVIVGVGSYLTARWIVGPLQTLSQTARALGAGDLKARTGLTRTDEVGDVGRSFDEMAERLQKLVQTERELLANVSHELRTPLARIRVALDIAAEANDGAGGISLSEVSTDLTEIEALIHDVMTTARLQIEGAAGVSSPTAFLPHFEAVAPAVLCARASERFKARHPRRLIAVEVPESLPTVRADPMLLRRAIDNVLENADKYSPDANAPVILRVERVAGQVVFEVRDHGVGISPQDLPQIFEPFFRSDRSRSREAGGVGLGLTLAKRIVDAHGGTIHATSVVARGTTVRLALPIPPVA